MEKKKKNKSKSKKKNEEESESGSDHSFEDKVAHYNFKLILVGSSEVGKTSITNRYVKDQFNDNELHSREVQILYKHFPIPDTKPPEIAELHIWDTLGQEKFKSVV
jgi:GTPase SAR1 family protein